MALILEKVLTKGILPAVTLQSEDQAIPVADALLEAGLNCMEITFRTVAAPGSIELIRKKRPEMYIGAGTLLSTEDIQQAIDAGAAFGLAPGFNPAVANYAREKKFPFIPGVFTPSEVEQAMAAGFHILKLFPVEQAGGNSYLKALYAPYAAKSIQFIPMGGVTVLNMREYLQQPNVIAIGGSWITAKNFIESKDYASITAAAGAALEQVPK